MTLTARIARRPGGAFQAWCPALPGCLVVGETQEEAWAKIQIAVNGYLASLGAALPRELGKRLEASLVANAA
jgi:predicted RNase H-like HicB family nuclease